MADSDDDDFNLAALFADENCDLQFHEVRSPLAENDSSFADISSLSFNMWDTARIDNLAKIARRSKRLLKLRVNLLQRLSVFLDGLGVNWCVYGGTALSVYRENGKFIAHDSDVDLALDEDDFGKVWTALHMEYQKEEEGLLPSRLVSWTSTCPFTREAWAHEDVNGHLTVKKFAFQKRSTAKYFKFFLTAEAWRELDCAKLFFDRDAVHIDLFTLGSNPTDTNLVVCNWISYPNYDPLRHTWPRHVFWPAQDDVYFEGVKVRAPNDIEAYLRGEYGYLGQPAVFDSALQLYVPLPPEVFDTLPHNVKKLFSSQTS